MRIAVAGGTGLVGRQVVALLEGGGHEAVPLSRGGGVDLISRDGLDDALTGVEAVIDTSNVTTLSRDRAAEFFTTATTNLAEAALRAGAGHLVVLSIVGVDRIPFGYYEAKLAQEQAAMASGIPVSVLRATQFHEFADQNIGRVKGPVAVIPRMRMRPVASSEVAETLVELAVAGPRTPLVELAGPEQQELVDLARRVVKARRLRRLVVPVRLPGEAGPLMAGGALIPQAEGFRTGQVTFDEWLAASLKDPSLLP